MKPKKSKLPQCIARCLWSYEPSAFNLQEDKYLIIRQVLNYGDWKGIQWLHRHYPERAIRQTVLRARRGMWIEQVLHFWCLMLKIKLPKKVYERAIMRMGPS